MKRGFHYLVIGFLLFTHSMAIGQALSKDQQKELVDGLMKIQPASLTEEQKEGIKKQLEKDANITTEEIEKEKNKTFGQNSWSSQEDGFETQKISTAPEIEEVDFIGSKIKRFNWSKITDDEFFLFKVAIGVPLKFDFEKLDSESKLDVLKNSVIVSGKALEGEIEGTKLSTWGNNSPLILWTSKFQYQNNTFKRIASTMVHRNKIWLIAVEYPEQTKGNPLDQFNWFYTQIRLF